MEPLFRLMLTRPAVAQDEQTPSIPLAQDSPFQAQLAQARRNPRPREALKAVARQFMTTAGFVGQPVASSVYAATKALAVALDRFERDANVGNGDVAAAIETAFGNSPAALVQSNVLAAPRVALRDSVLAIKQLPEAHRRPIAALTDQLRDLEVIVKVAADPSFPGTGPALRRYRRRSVQLPGDLVLGSSLSTEDRQHELEQLRKEADEKRREDANEKLDRYRQLTAAIEELTALGSDHLHSTPQVAEAGFMVPAQFRVTQLALDDVAQAQQHGHLDVLRSQAALRWGAGVDRQAAAIVAAPLASTPAPARRFLGGKGQFTPTPISATAFRLKPTAEQTLSAATLTLLKQRGLGVAVDPLDRIVEKLRLEALQLSEALDALLGRPVHRTFKRVGKSLVMITTPMATVWNSMVMNDDLKVPDLPFPGTDSVPLSHGSVAPAGVADLLVVRQQLVRYEGADVAHIENILRGEKKEREHARRRETEELTFREVETTTSEERELESTSRFEMSQETTQTLREDAALKAGLSLSGKYGPSVEFTASAEGSVSRSREEATRSASSFSQDVTERSASKITERVLQRSSLRVTNEVIEKNRHGFDNVAGAGHVSGVYQWVNKVYQAQMFNYGIRMTYDFMVAEPAAFLIGALQSAHASAVELEKPIEFTLRPDQITESNYHGWIKQYGATDVQAPPEMYKTKSLDFNAAVGPDSADYSHSGQIPIDDGYKAVFGAIGIASNIWEDNATIDAVLGQRTHRFQGNQGLVCWTTALNDETESIPLALGSWKYSQIAAAVEVKCQRTERALLKWRLETHAKLTTAYKARRAEYEEKLKALEVQAGVAIRGRHPALNLEMMNDELKKHCISILTEQHFDLFDAVETGAHGVAQLDLAENAAEGPYVRFFEQAFEWEQMTWLAYPYFWGRKSQWAQRIAYEDPDPIFNHFLKAGYCRVVVPVRPGFEGALDHFTTYGEIWSGGPLPAISNPLYLPIADELAERLDRPGDELPQGEPWLVRIPTTLVRLRPDDQLPAWRRDENGDWIEA